MFSHSQQRRTMNRTRSGNVAYHVVNTIYCRRK
nr:MAG TPA: hypothetical protein [Caudoviricetes sp.]